jgi:anti-sigma-K factor RskA
MAKVGATRQLSPLLSSRSHPASRRLSSGGWSAGVAGVAAAAALLLAIGSGVLAGRVNDRSYDQTAAELLDQSDTRIIDMPGPNGARVRVAWSPTIAKAVVTGENLPNPGPGKAYELWLIDDNGARPAGLLDRAADGTIHRVIGLPGAAAALGITIEAATGSATPTAPVLFSSSA